MTITSQRPAGPALGMPGGIGLALVYGVIGQDLGGLFTGQATDPGTGPLLVLIALALWPRAMGEPAGQRLIQAPSHRQVGT